MTGSSYVAFVLGVGIGQRMSFIKVELTSYVGGAGRKTSTRLGERGVRGGGTTARHVNERADIPSVGSVGQRTIALLPHSLFGSCSGSQVDFKLLLGSSISIQTRPCTIIGADGGPLRVLGGHCTALVRM